MDSPIDHRRMFECYLYDYLIKKGLHETAEIFRRETDTAINTQSPPEIDVPEGFLREWWLINSDHLSGWQRKNSQDNDSSSCREQSEMWQHGVPTQSGEHELNEQNVPTHSGEHELAEQMIKKLSLDESFGVILGGNLLPSQSEGNRKKRSRDSEDENKVTPGANNSHLETSSTVRNMENLFGLASCAIVVEKKKDEGNFSSKNEEEDSSSRDGYMYDSSCHDKSTEDDDVISAINLNEPHEAPKYDKSQGVITKGNLVPETGLHPERLTCSSHSAICRKNEGKRKKPGDCEHGSINMPGVIIGGILVSETMPTSGSSIMSSPPANLDGTDTQGLDSVVQTKLRRMEIESHESGGNRNWLGDPEDGSTDVPEHDDYSK